MNSLLTSISCCLAVKSETRACRRWSASLQLKNLFILKAAQNPARLALLKATIFGALHSKDPSSSNIISHLKLGTDNLTLYYAMIMTLSRSGIRHGLISVSRILVQLYQYGDVSYVFELNIFRMFPWT